MIVPSRSVATIFMDTIVSHAVSSAVTARGAALNPSGRVTAGGDHHFRWNLDADLLPHGPRPAPAPSRRKHGPTRAFRDRWCHPRRSEEHTSELQSRGHLVCRLLLEKK